MRMNPRPPGLYRWSRLFRRLSTLAVVVVVTVSALAVYSATQVRPAPGAAGGLTQLLLPNGTVELGATFNLSNPGPFAFTHLRLVAVVSFPGAGLLAVGGTPDSTIAGASTGVVPLTIFIPMATSPVGATLLTHDAALPVDLWLNTTYAGLASAAIRAATNFTWGAPFAQFNATPGPPAPQPNGTLQVPVEITFSDHAVFGDVGTITVRVVSSAGVTCATSSLPIATPAGAAFAQGLSFYLGAGCDPSGGQLLVSYDGPGISAAFPPEALP